MKKKLTRNIGLKILSILLAAVLWLVITNVDDPVEYETFTKNVTILNEHVMNTPNQSYEIIGGNTVEFTVGARRSIIDDLTGDDFNVTADFSDFVLLNDVYSVMINITPKKYKNEIVIDNRSKYQSMKVNIEEVSWEDFKVNIIEKGEVMEGYYLGPETASPNMIRVSGPKSRIEKIQEVVVEVNVTDASKSITRITEPIALDEEGNVIDATNLNFSEKLINVGIELYKIKEIDLLMVPSGEPADGYVLTGFDYQPKKIEIAAEESVLNSINTLKVTKDITGAVENIEEYIDLQDELDDKYKGVILVGEDKTASVNISIEKIETKDISIWPNDIELKNKSDFLEAIFITKGPIIVKVMGPAKEISGLSRNTLNPFIDLKNSSAGTYPFTIQANLSDKAKIYDTPMVRMTLSP